MQSISIQDKKGSKLLSVYWFFILVIIAGGIVAMASIFYGSSYDVREKEAEILAIKVADCISQGGKMDTALISGGVFKDEFRDNFLTHCSLSFANDEEFKPVQYYVNISFYKGGDKRSDSFPIAYGNKNWVEDCGVDASGKENLATCFEKNFFVADDVGNFYLVKILTIIGKTDENS